MGASSLLTRVWYNERKEITHSMIPTRYPDAFPSGTPVEQFFGQDARGRWLMLRR
jgi:HEPN domain-containing protein